jgi:hypothetical protein
MKIIQLMFLYPRYASINQGSFPECPDIVVLYIYIFYVDFVCSIFHFAQETRIVFED